MGPKTDMKPNPKTSSRRAPSASTVAQLTGAPAPDPIAQRLLRLALDRQADLLGALEDARRHRGRDAAGLGLVFFGEGLGHLMPPGAVVVHDRAQLWAICRRLGVEASAGCERFFPVLILDGGQACLVWLGPLSAPGGLAA